MACVCHMRHQRLLRYLARMPGRGGGGLRRENVLAPSAPPAWGDLPSARRTCHGPANQRGGAPVKNSSEASVVTVLVGIGVAFSSVLSPLAVCDDCSPSPDPDHCVPFAP